MTARMDSPGRIPSSPPPKGVSLEEELAYYKTQYNQVELELQEFQNSSKELEAELEKDIEESESRERRLREKAEALNFEVDEWKTKYKQSKSESNSAQNVLQKEITTLRDSNRTLQYKLRDIEVANDDFERQARHQHSSLEDLESKYNVAIERGVMLEEEIKIGEQEREGLRVETQRLKDELSEMKVELEIVQGKLRHAETTIERDRSRQPLPIATESLRAPSPLSEGSTATATSSPSALTPPPSQSEPSLQTSPPSPPLSEASGTTRPKAAPKTPLPRKSIFSQSTTTPRPSNLSGIRPPRHSRGPSIPGPSIAPRTPLPSSKTARPANPRLSVLGQERPNPRSGSLHQVRGLISKMQKLEERVHTARSKLPAPTATPPRASPRGSTVVTNSIPSSVTVRSARKRTSASTTSSFTQQSTDPPRSASRLSFGFAGKVPESPSRPSSRASQLSVSGQFARPERPSSRASVTGRSTPSGNRDMHRPRSSISGSYAAVHGSTRPEPPRSSTPGPRLGHSFSRSVSAVAHSSRDDHSGEDLPTPLTARRTTMDRNVVTGIPAPGSIARRQSGGLGKGGGARRQSGAGPALDAGANSGGEMRPPSSKGRRLSGVGETY